MDIHTEQYPPLYTTIDRGVATINFQEDGTSFHPPPTWNMSTTHTWYVVQEPGLGGRGVHRLIYCGITEIIQDVRCGSMFLHGSLSGNGIGGVNFGTLPPYTPQEYDR